MSLTDKQLERLLSGEPADEAAPGLRERSAEAADDAELLRDLEFMASLDSRLSDAPGIPAHRREQRWKRAGREIDLATARQRAARRAHRRSQRSSMAALADSLWDFVTDVFTMSTSRLRSEDPVAVSEDLVDGGYPMTQAQRQALAEIIREYGVFQNWRRRQHLVRAVRWSLGTGLAAALILAAVLSIGPEKAGPGPKDEVAVNLLNGQVEFSGDFLETPATSTGYVSVADHAHIAMAQSSVLKVVSDTRAELKTGSVWLDVDPAGQGFEVDTQFGSVIVTGTSFGVTMTPEGARFEVVEGSVIVRRNGVERKVAAGEFLTADELGLADEVASRPGDLFRPDWAADAPLFAGEPLVINCDAMRLFGNWHMRAEGNGLVLQRLGRPIRERARFTLRFMQTSGFSEQFPEDVHANGFFAFGEVPDDDGTVKCGVHIVDRKIRIFEGPWTASVPGNRSLSHRDFAVDPSKPVSAVVDVDLVARRISMFVNGQRLDAPLPDHINEIRYVGYSTTRAQSAFTPVSVEFAR